MKMISLVPYLKPEAIDSLSKQVSKQKNQEMTLSFTGNNICLEEKAIKFIFLGEQLLTGYAGGSFEAEVNLPEWRKWFTENEVTKKIFTTP